MTEQQPRRLKRTFFGCLSYGMSLVLIALLVGSAGWNWMRTEALITGVSRWAARMQVTTVAQMHADRALALAESSSFRADELEDSCEALIRKLHHLQVEHMQVIMEVELYKGLIGPSNDYIRQLTDYIQENGLPVPAPEVKECPPQPARDASSFNSQRHTIPTQNDPWIFPGGTFQRNSTELDVSGMGDLHEACQLN